MATPMDVDAAGPSTSAAATSKPDDKDLPWVRPPRCQHANNTELYLQVEKYRPSLIEDIVGNEEAVERLQVIAAEGNMPHLILSGPPGTGKTTSILALAQALLGPHYKAGVLELNASDDRGIDTVRSRIKMFAQQKVTLPPGRHKVIILDEADSMTTGAQQALRRIMELYSSTTRFALACNQSSKIIEPIQSRCAIVRYTKLNDAQVLSRLLRVCEAEQVAYTKEGLEAIIFTADGDMRQALNNLQATVSGFSMVTPDNVFKVCDQPPPLLVSKIVGHCAEAQLEEAYDSLKALYDCGYSATDIIVTLFRVVRNSTTLNEFVKLEFLKEVGFCQMRIAEGVNSLLQLTGLLAKLCKVALKGKS